MFEGDSNARKIIALTAFVCVIGGLMIAGQVSAAGGTAPKVDWSCDYDKELERFFKLVVKHAEEKK